MSLLLKTTKSIEHTIFSHKIELLTAFAFAIFVAFLNKDQIVLNSTYLIFLPIYLAIIYLSRHFKPAYFASVLVPILGSFLVYKIDKMSEFYLSNPKFWAINIIAVILFLSDKFAKENRAFIRNLIQKIYNLALAICIFFLLTIIVTIVVSGIDYLFDARLMQGSFWYKIYIMAQITIVPFLFFLFEDWLNFEFSGKIFRQILNFLLTPTLIIYTIILYAYTANIAFISGLPKGGVAIIVLCYLITGFILSALHTLLDQSPESKPPKLNFYSMFSYISIAPIVLLWVAIAERIATYALTPSRIYLVATAIFVSVIYMFMMLKRWFSYRICAVFGVIFTAILFFAINTNQISLNSQISRLHSYLKELNLLDQNKAIKAIDISNLTDDQKIKIIDIYHDIKRFDYKYKIKNNENLIELIEQEIQLIKEESLTSHQSLSLKNFDINITDYKKIIILDQKFSPATDGFLDLYLDDKLIIKIDLNKHINSVFKANMLDIHTAHSRKILEQIAKDIMVIDTPNGTLVLNQLNFSHNKKDGYKITAFKPNFFLQKE